MFCAQSGKTLKYFVSKGGEKLLLKKAGRTVERKVDWLSGTGQCV
jgi:hypothetical protein